MTLKNLHKSSWSHFFIATTLLLSVVVTPINAAPGDITTVAGGGVADGGPATSSPLVPFAIDIDGFGNIFVTDRDHSRVRKIDTSGIITTIAGNGAVGFSGDGGLAINASLSSPESVVVDTAGNVYIADRNNARVRKVDPSGIITTVAGNGTVSFTAENILATNEGLTVNKIVLDSIGNIYIADYFNRRVRKVDTSGIITTVAGNGTATYAGDGTLAINTGLTVSHIALDSTGNLYIADDTNKQIRMVDLGGVITTIAGDGTTDDTGDGGLATAASFKNLSDISTDITNNIYITDGVSQRVRVIDNSTGIITTIAGNGLPGYSGDGGMATSASILLPRRSKVDSLGNLYITDNGNARIRKVDLSGIITSIAGSGEKSFSGGGGLATAANLSFPHSVATSGGDVYIADTFNERIRKIGTGNIINTIAGDPASPILPYATSASALLSRIISPTDIITDDSTGDIYIADQAGQRIYKVTNDGSISTVAGQLTFGYSGDGGLAIDAELNRPGSIALDSAGNLYIADTENHRIRKVNTSGIITSLAGSGIGGFSGDGGLAILSQLNKPTGIYVDTLGNIYFADSNNHRIRKIQTDGTIVTIAGNGTGDFSGDGGPAVNASLNSPRQITSDALGNLYIADRNNHRIRKIDTSNIISTIAGDGTRAFTGDNAPAIAASLSNPSDVAMSAAGHLYIADLSNQRIRRIESVINGPPTAAFTSTDSTFINTS
ncbi:MAG: hypothetical protein KAU29_08875, partial [Gammaproteobacteria bacterium]|nr:hypothetical protein [Gammaproteobacteria bacterium]